MRMLSVLVSRSKVDFITVANDVHLNSQLVYPAPDFLNLLPHTAEALELLDMPVFIHG